LSGFSFESVPLLELLWCVCVAGDVDVELGDASGGTYGHALDDEEGAVTCTGAGAVALCIGHPAGGVAVDDGMACGGVGCADAVFAQNQPMLIIRCEVMNYRKGGRGD